MLICLLRPGGRGAEVVKPAFVVIRAVSGQLFILWLCLRQKLKVIALQSQLTDIVIKIYLRALG
jgi:hypothetical protein